MYPHRYYELFPAFPDTVDVFVGMSFHPKFDDRYKTVVQPGIEAVSIGKQKLRPFRVDARVISDSILTEILSGIGRSRLIFLDITSEGILDAKPIRNGNVMYELGIAHSTRIPEEVIVFRSDDDSLLFDTANIRVNKYDPEDGISNAMKKVANAVLSAIHEIDITRNKAVAKAASSLDAISWDVLMQATRPPGVRHFSTSTMGDALGNAKSNTSILRLLDMGAIAAEYKILTKENIAQALKSPPEEFVVYRATPFGNAVNEYVAKQMRLTAPDIVSEPLMQKAMEDQLKKET